ncbi:MAG: prolipoprotein diacylglyceryl transferase [Alistipes sp.]|nr:prolipoprotein diacylglyceryl transferase [Alistipes sp.]
MKINLFSIGKLTVHGYGLMIGIGVLCCVFMASRRAKKKGLSADAIMDIAVYGLIAGFIGAKLLFLVVEFKDFIQDPLRFLSTSGFVVYGGIIAGVIAAIVYCRKKGYVFMEYFDLAAPSIAMAQGFGRIGCFLAGCCYGRPTDSFLGVVFPENSMAPAGIKLLPTQLFSSAGDFLIMAVLLLYSRKSGKPGNVGILYMVLYGIGRFFIEFLRIDDRGGFWRLSTSQWISIGIVILAVVLYRIVNREEA